MRKRRIYLGLLLLAVAVGAIVVCFKPEREPEYGGKKLSEWLPKLVKSPADQDRAAEAIRQIGPNALPYLLKWTRYNAPPWKSMLYQAINTALGTLNSDWGVTDEHEERQAYAALAFRALGRQAESAIPELTRMMNDPKQSDTAAAAAQVLGMLGNVGLPPLLAVLTNFQRPPILRSFAAWEIGILGTNIEASVPVLQSVLTDTNSIVREAATNALGAISTRALKTNRSRRGATN